ncbi:MAG: DNA replication/repair protein RecF [Clostridia bacterium]|nr:DNA replication/repair protein RecF [Clostridia bacterium]
MFIKSISFENYRNLKTDIFFPAKGINVIYGDNAQGKTNLLECIWLFTGGRSFRGARENELVAFGTKYAKISLCFESEERGQGIEITISGGKRSAVLNDVPKKQMSQIIGSFCAVVFSPNHLSLIKNGPEERRNFIDAALCQIKPSYAVTLSRYKRALNERNALLKDIPKNRQLEDMLDVWDEKLAETGVKISAERRRYVKLLSGPAGGFYDGISSGRETLTLEYKSSLTENGEESPQELIKTMISALEARRQEDIMCGYTTVGVHRDDLSVKINDRDARKFGSQGQQRSAVLAMKLAEAYVIGKERGEQPVILLDDVLSELDPSRQNYLLNKLEGMQVFITCCEEISDAGNIVKIENGKIFSMEE